MSRILPTRRARRRADADEGRDWGHMSDDDLMLWGRALTGPDETGGQMAEPAEERDPELEAVLEETNRREPAEPSAPDEPSARSRLVAALGRRPRNKPAPGDHATPPSLPVMPRPRRSQPVDDPELAAVLEELAAADEQPAAPAPPASPAPSPAENPAPTPAGPRPVRREQLQAIRHTEPTLTLAPDLEPQPEVQPEPQVMVEVRAPSRLQERLAGPLPEVARRADSPFD